jgi:hypothetical protein
VSARHRHSRKTRVVVTTAAALVLLGGLALEGTLVHATRDARADLPQAVARAARGGGPADALPGLVEARAYGEVADALSSRAEAVPTPASRTLAAHAATAAGRHRDAARHAAFAARLRPDDEATDRQARDTANLALLGRLRPFARVLAAAGVLVLAFGMLRGVRRRCRRRRMRRWLAGLAGHVAVGVDGRTFSSSSVDVATVPPDTQSVVVDVFLRGRRPRRRPPRPGPTLAVVLSHAGSSLTLRLRPRHDVREDAVRIRLTDETLSRLLGAPGTWRLAAHLGGRLVSETALDVLPRVRRRRGQRFPLFAHA